jgi:hypothetical protein
MTFSLKLFTRSQLTVMGAAFAFALLLLSIAPAIAGGDATFAPMTAQLSAWLSGSLGYLIALAAFVIGVFNAVRGDRGFWGMAFPFFLSIIITVGITVIQGGFTAVV